MTEENQRQVAPRSAGEHESAGSGRPSRPNMQQSAERPPQPAKVTRPPGEVGGHTVQPEEQPGPMLSSDTKPLPGAKDVPAPEETPEAPSHGSLDQSTLEARHASGSAPAGAAGVKPAARDASKGAGNSQAIMESQGRVGDVVGPPKGIGRGDPQDDQRAAGPDFPTGPQAKGVDKEALTQEILECLSRNIAKALHQSVVQAVEEALGGRKGNAGNRPRPPNAAPGTRMAADAKTIAQPQQRMGAPAAQGKEGKGGEPQGRSLEGPAPPRAGTGTGGAAA